MDAVLIRYWREKRTMRAKCQVGARSDIPRVTFVILVFTFGVMSWKQLTSRPPIQKNSSPHLRTVLASVIIVVMVCATLHLFYSVVINVMEARKKLTRQRHFEMNLLCISILATLSSLLGIICIVSGIIFHDNLKKFNVAICANSYCVKYPLECFPLATGQIATNTTTPGFNATYAIRPSDDVEQSCYANFLNFTPLCGAAIILCALSLMTDGHYYYKRRREVILLDATSHPPRLIAEHWPVRYRVQPRHQLSF